MPPEIMAPNDATEDSAYAEQPADGAVDKPDNDAALEAQPDDQNTGETTLDREEMADRMRQADYTRKRQLEAAELRQAKAELEAERREVQARGERLSEDERLMALVRKNPELREQFVGMVAPHLSEIPDDESNSPVARRLDVLEAREAQRVHEQFIGALGDTSVQIMRKHGLTAVQMQALGTKAINEGEVTSGMTPNQVSVRLNRFVRAELFDTAATIGQKKMLDQIDGQTNGPRALKPGGVPSKAPEVDVTTLTFDEVSEKMKRELGFRVD